MLKRENNSKMMNHPSKRTKIKKFVRTRLQRNGLWSDLKNIKYLKRSK